LRYKLSGEARQKALQDATHAVSALLRLEELPELELGEGTLQIDLVLNAAELAALAFEVAADKRGTWLSVRKDKPVVITRRVRNDADTPAMRWPSKPRILFAWASPDDAGVQVPWKDHAAELSKVLEPWAPLTRAQASPNLGNVLMELPKVTL